jgi:hypothetical protein
MPTQKMNRQAEALSLRLSTHKGTYTGFHHSGGRQLVKGWWERKDGSEGGELLIDLSDCTLADYDGAYSLPEYVKAELVALGVTITEQEEV